MVLMSWVEVMAQYNKEWQPTGVWPFVHKTFRVAKLTYGFTGTHTTERPANIHIGNQSVWYYENGTTMEGVQGNIHRVEFQDGTTYIPVENYKYYGRIVREDTLQGHLARVIDVQIVDQRRVDQECVSLMNHTTNLLQSGDLGNMGGALGSFASAVADANSGEDVEERPIPITHAFYFYFKGDTFPITTKNILNHIRPERKKEYRAFTRSAEIISTNESSVMKIWDNFFVKF